MDFLADVLKKEKISIIELAPMTNLARLIQKDKKHFPVLRRLFPWAAALKVMETVHLLQNTITGVTRTALPWLSLIHIYADTPFETSAVRIFPQLKNGAFFLDNSFIYF